MKNKNFYHQLFMPETSGENRVVFVHEGGPKGGEVKEKPDTREGLFGEIRAGAEGKIGDLEATSGQKIDIAALADTRDSQATGEAVQGLLTAWNGQLESSTQKNGTIEEMFTLWEKLTDQVNAFLAALGFNDARRRLNEAPTQSAGEQLNLPDHLDEGEKKMAGDTRKHLKNMEAVLSKQPQWRGFISEAAQRRGIDESIIAGFIEMESGFNPLAKPHDPKTKMPDLRVIGLGQARQAAIKDYTSALRKEGKDSNINMIDPQTGIDFVAWYCVEIMHDVNTQISQKGLPGEYALSEENYIRHEDFVKNLYVAYHEGPTGYLRFRMNKEASHAHVDAYSSEVASLVEAYEALNDSHDVTLARAPLPNVRITSSIATRVHPINGHVHFHTGVDLGAPLGTPVSSVKSGKVTEVHAWDGKDPNGNYISVKHNDGSTTKYLHLNSIDVSLNQDISEGTQVGTVGNTGASTAPHLHFMYLDRNGNYKNPEAALRAFSQQK